MKQIQIVLIAIMLTLIAHADWKTLKQIEDYPGNAYNLKKNVAYMEIRLYKSKKSERANRIITLYRKPLSSYQKSVISKFKNLEKKYSNKESYLQIRNNGNAFFIDTNGKMFWTDEIKDIKMLLGKIDTPAELALVLWLGYENGWQSYKQTSNGYKIKRTTWVSACFNDRSVNSVDMRGNYDDGNVIRHIIRKKCKSRKHTQFITHKTVDYESYNHIAIDDRENIYVVGYVNKNKTYQSDDYNVLDKYSSSGKLLWSKKVAGFLDVKVENNFIYLIDNHKIEAKYTTDGKKRSFRRGEIKLRTKQKWSNKYDPKLLPKERKNIMLTINDQSISKKGNVYVTGVETFYPNGTPDGSEMCGNNGQVDGAVIAKFNKNGKMLWAKVLDRDD